MTPAASDAADLAGKIREAVSSGDFPEAQRLWREYGQRFREDLRRGALPHSRLTEARELAQWTKTMALCARAFARDRLQRTVVAQQYRDYRDATPPPPTLTMRG